LASPPCTARQISFPPPFPNSPTALPLYDRNCAWLI
jgi:hypothetical protein